MPRAAEGLAAVAAFLLVAAAWPGPAGAPAPAPARQSGAGAAVGAAVAGHAHAPALGHASATRREAAARRPVRLTIPAIGVDGRLEALGLLPDGRLAPPRDPDRPGWWRGGPRPGRAGAAVLAGHVDSFRGPAVFARLRELRRGDRIFIEDRTGERFAFRVRRTEEHHKDGFPTQRVYGPTRRPALRLVTCAGRFNRATGHYETNLIVFAAAAGRPAGAARVTPRARIGP